MWRFNHALINRNKMKGRIVIFYVFSYLPALIYSGKIWWITDLHFDINGDLLPSLPVCAWTPPSLFHSGLQMMSEEEPNPDFIIISGDFIHIPGRSGTDELSVKNILATIQTVTDLVSEKFPDVPILPCIGNHEYSPSKNWPDDKWSQWLYQPLSKMWGKWLPQNSLEVFSKHGYYTTVYDNGLRVIALNTNYWAWDHQIMTFDATQAGVQFEWLERTLASARNLNQSVYIIGHHPMVGRYWGYDVDDLVPMYSLRYNTIIQKYKGIIMGQFSGHEHYNEFRVMRSCRFLPSPQPLNWQSCTGEPMAVVFVGQCMSNCRDPGVRLWMYNDRTFELKDYNQYGYSNTNKSWTLRYNFKKTYIDMPDMSASSFQAEIDRMSNDNHRFTAFMKRRWEDSTDGGQGGSCDDTCKRFQLCNLSFGASISDFLRCTYYGYNKMVEQSIGKYSINGDDAERITAVLPGMKADVNSMEDELESNEISHPIEINNERDSPMINIQIIP